MAACLPLRRTLAGAAGALLVAACVPQALAQEIQQRPNAAQRCLTPSAQQRGTPVYPDARLKAGVRGRVQVELVFGTRDERPEVTVLDAQGGDEFVDSVLAHVRQLRTPCLEDIEITARLVQDYVFEQQRVSWQRDSDPDAVRQLEMRRCMTRVDGSKAPDYPTQARMTDLVGRVVVSMVFTAPDQPPDVRGFHAPGRGILASNSESWAQGYRMPCLQGGPVSVDRVFVYNIEGQGTYGFRDVSFVGYVSKIKDLEKQTLRLDTRTMGCPFELKLEYRQPWMANRIGEVGTVHSARAALFDWLERSELELSRVQRLSAFGDTVALTVPCIVLDLKPKE